MIFEQLIDVGQIRQGDTLIIFDGGKAKQFTAKEVLHPGTKREEVIVKVKKNYYFITLMSFKGESWARDVHIIRRDDQ